MIRLGVALLAASALAGCGESAYNPGEAADSDGQQVSADQPMGPGLYTINSRDRVYSRTRIHPEGTYTDYDGGGNVVGGGKWSAEGALICFDPNGDGEDEQESCWISETPSGDGSFVIQLADGDTRYTVVPQGE